MHFMPYFVRCSVSLGHSCSASIQIWSLIGFRTLEQLLTIWIGSIFQRSCNNISLLSWSVHSSQFISLDWVWSIVQSKTLEWYWYHFSHSVFFFKADNQKLTNKIMFFLIAATKVILLLLFGFQELFVRITPKNVNCVYVKTTFIWINGIFLREKFAFVWTNGIEFQWEFQWRKACWNISKFYGNCLYIFYCICAFLKQYSITTFHRAYNNKTL